ncbi:alpha/beta fold hydrolase [Dyadobacter aurulentus]|uniref:alpha/beta fold hydrolase n=1 Tax=Dyadobacter sp. UC 10 TaxID=2605428 RepID=UPI0011F368E5|nr:alpha/beta fold hydrolase [Dyadobacter sp. UC 10]KAA0988686.1 alpha/beta hydrolase [Dyadobacter sp. UC 10]
MEQQVTFFHGGGSAEDYEADEKLVASLRSQLGSGYSVQYPFLPDDGTPDLGRRRQISEEISAGPDGLIVVAHSLGASMLLAYLSETEITKKIAGIFLLATPFWEGKEDWVEPFRLKSGFAKKIDKKIALFFYHCQDDEEVPFAQLSSYKKQLSWAHYREFATGGHQFGDDLTAVARDIMAI